MKKLFLLLSLLAFYPAGPSFADECYGIVIEDFGENNSEEHKAGEIISQLHAYDADALGLPETYAVHGGSVYPAKKIHLLNCHIVKKDNKEYPYDTVLDDTLENQPEIRRQQTESTLMSLHFKDNESFCYAEASNLGWEYGLHPGSNCSKAINQLINDTKQGKEWTRSDWDKAPCHGDLG